eukprot:Em0021g919a
MQSTNNLSLSYHRVLTRSWSKETHRFLSNDRCLWAGQSHSTTRFYSKCAIDVDVEELDCLLSEESVQLFDVREPSELLETGKIPRSVNIPLAEVEEAFRMTPDEFLEKYKCRKPSKEDSNIVFHCRKGVRSLKALNTAHQLGYTKSRHLYLGFAGWADHWKDTNPTKVETISK